MKVKSAVIFLCLASMVSSSIVPSEAADRRSSVVHATECSGSRRINLHEDDEVILETPGYNAAFTPGCAADWEVRMLRRKNDIGQWRLRVDVLDMKIPCNSAELRIMEDAEKAQNILYCDEQDEDYHNHIFFSHEHMIHLDFFTKRICKSADGCDGTGARIRIKAEYVCGGRFTEDNGEITSPLYPGNYPYNTACIYDISAPAGKRVTLTCPEFNLSTQCDEGPCKPQAGDRDFFQNVFTLERFEATEMQGVTFTSNGFHQTVYFVSNSHEFSAAEGSFGFRCTYKFI